MVTTTSEEERGKMGYDEALAQRVRQLLINAPEVTERKMFGDVAFLVRGHMTIVASGKGGLMVRIVLKTRRSLCRRRPRSPPRCVDDN